MILPDFFLDIVFNVIGVLTCRMIDIETIYFEQLIYFDAFEEPLNKRCMYGMSLSIFFAMWKLGGTKV